MPSCMVHVEVDLVKENPDHECWLRLQEPETQPDHTTQYNNIFRQGKGFG